MSERTPITNKAATLAGTLPGTQEVVPVETALNLEHQLNQALKGEHPSQNQRPISGDHPDITRNYHGGNPESKEANNRTNKERDRAAILQFLLTVPDATCDEFEQKSGMKHQTASARFSELKREQLIVPTSKRPTRTGSPAQAFCHHTRRFTRPQAS